MKRWGWLFLLAGCSVAPDVPRGGIRIVEVRVPATLPVQASLDVTVALRAGIEAPLEFDLVIEGGPEEVRERIRIPGPGDHTIQVRMKGFPRGDYRLRTAVGESSVTSFIRIRHGRTRVLYVEHLPRYEFRFLKNALIKDPMFDVHTFLVTAEPGFSQEHTLETGHHLFATPLAKLPETLEELLVYDVLILGDVEPAVLLPAIVEKFVSEHGRGLVVISGEQNMPRKWKGTAFDSLLPVEVGPESAPLPLKAGYRLTDAGRASPLVAVGPDVPRTVDLWEDPKQLGTGLVGVRWALQARSKQDAQTLVETRDKNLPLFVTRETGKGRVFFSGTDETWLWRYLVGDHPYFFPFWRRVIEWANRVE